MTNPATQGASPALVVWLKRLGRDWRDLADRARDIKEAIRLERTEEDHAECRRLLASFHEHPILDLFRFIEEFTGIDRETIWAATWRINSSIGLRPLLRPRKQETCTADDAQDDLPDGEETKPDLPDLRWLFPKFTECDVNGTTARILAAFTELHPSVLSQGLRLPSPGADTTQDKNGIKKTRGKDIDAKMLKVMAENAESYGWSARRWAEYLQCSDGTVKGTKTWKERLKAARATAAADAARKMDESHTSPTGRRRKKP